MADREKVIAHLQATDEAFGDTCKERRKDLEQMECPARKAQREDEAASDMRTYCERYEPTCNPEDGSM